MALLASISLSGCALLVSTSDLSGGPGAGPSSDGGRDGDSVPPEAAPMEVADAADAGESTPEAGDASDAGGDPSIVWPVNGHRYILFITKGSLGWNTARAEAKARGGDLASLTTGEERAFIGAFVDKYPAATVDSYGPWIGGFQPEPKPADEPANGWVWVSGEPWVDIPWLSGEPNDTGASEHYAHFFADSEHWNDSSENNGSIHSAIFELVP